MNDSRTQVAQSVRLPVVSTIRYGGQFQSEQRATRVLVLYSLFAPVVIASLMLIVVLISGGVLLVGLLIGFITCSAWSLAMASDWWTISIGVIKAVSYRWS